MDRTRPDGFAEIPVGREGPDDRIGVTGGQGVLVATDHVIQMDGPGPEDRGPHVAPSVNRPLAAVGAEDHRSFIRRFGDHGQRPRHLLTVVGQVREQLDDSPPAVVRRRHGLTPGVALGPEFPIMADEPLQRLVTADRADAGVVDHDVTGPRLLQHVRIPAVERGEVPGNRVRLAGSTGLSSRQLRGTDEVRKPWHRTLRDRQLRVDRRLPTVEGRPWSR